MSAEKIYYGIKKVPKGYKKATAQQARDNNQVRLWGLYKIDSRLLTSSNNQKKIEKECEKLIFKMSAYRGKLLKLEKDLPYTRDPQAKIQIKEEMNKLKKELNQVIKQLKKFE